MQINVEELLGVMRYLKDFDSCPLDEIEWIYKGEKLNIDPKVLSKWKFVGLNNSYFIENYINNPEITKK